MSIFSAFPTLFDLKRPDIPAHNPHTHSGYNSTLPSKSRSIGRQLRIEFFLPSRPLQKTHCIWCSCSKGKKAKEVSVTWCKKNNWGIVIVAYITWCNDTAAPVFWVSLSIREEYLPARRSHPSEPALGYNICRGGCAHDNATPPSAPWSLRFICFVRLRTQRRKSAKTIQRSTYLPCDGEDRWKNRSARKDTWRTWADISDLDFPLGVNPLAAPSGQSNVASYLACCIPNPIRCASC